eukprot:5781877-Pyramimonas_sp.AAC.1
MKLRTCFQQRCARKEPQTDCLGIVALAVAVMIIVASHHGSQYATDPNMAGIFIAVMIASGGCSHVLAVAAGWSW